MTEPVPVPIHDAKWEGTIPKAGYASPESDLVAHLMEMYELAKPEAKAVLEKYHAEQIQTLVNRRWNADSGEWKGVAL